MPVARYHRLDRSRLLVPLGGKVATGALRALRSLPSLRGSVALSIKSGIRMRRIRDGNGGNTRGEGEPWRQ